MARVSNETLSAKLDALIEQVSDVSKRQQEQLTRHENAIYGNGKPGIITELRHLQDGHSAILWTVRIATGAMIAGLVGLFFK